MTARPGRAAVIGIAAALVTALVHLLVIGVRREVFDIFSWLWWSRDQVWVTPLAYLVAFSPFIVVTAAAHALWPRRASLAAVGAFFTAFSGFCVLLLWGRIASWAWLLVAAAVGLRSLALFRVHESALVRWSARLTLGLGVPFSVWGLVIVQGGARAEQSAIAALPPAPEGAPNVLMIILDTVRAQSLSLYGGPDSTTPALARWAARGVVFDQAFSTAPWTLPSHVSMFSGRYGSHQSGDWKSVVDSEPAMLAEVFRDHGYATGAFVANLMSTGYRTGLGRGFIRYEDNKRTFGEIVLNSTLAQSTSLVRAYETWRDQRWAGRALRELASFNFRPIGNYSTHERKTVEEVSRDFLAWQRTVSGRPFFAFLNVFDAHGPYVAPASYADRFSSRTGAERKYLRAIRYIDDTLDQLLRDLEQRGVLQNVIVVITSDHGELFGEHKLWGHGNGLYLPLLHVPLVVIAPGRVAGNQRIAQVVSLRDLAPTLLQLANLPYREGGIGGVSLHQLVTGRGPVTGSAVIAEVNRGINETPKNPTYRADMKTVIDDTLHGILNSHGRLEAFAHRSDGAEATNLAADSARRVAIAKWMDSTLEAARVQWPLRREGRRRAAEGER